MWGKQKSGLSRYFLFVGIVLVLALLLRLLVIKPYEIPSPSMEPTLMPGDRILVNKLAHKLWAPNRGDVVVFQYPKNPDRVFIKRVIGLEGEKVEIRENHVLINGKPLTEPYLKEREIPPFPPEKIPEGKILVLGDNRNQSEDSRDWGLLPKEYLLGKAFFIYWPVNRIQVIR